MDHFRARRRWQAEEEVPEAADAVESSAEDAAIRAMSSESMLDLIEELSDEQRHVLILKFVFDFSKISSLFGATPGANLKKTGPGGTLDFDVAVSAHLHDYGAKITIRKPTVDPTAPKPPSGGLFGGLAG